MSTEIKPTVSQRNEYYVEKNRYYELKYFCLQYPIWKTVRANLSAMSERPLREEGYSKTNNVSNPTERAATGALYLGGLMEMVETAAKFAGEDLWELLLLGVTENLTYEKLRAKYDIPCCRETYYQMYRKFFWKLHALRM